MGHVILTTDVNELLEKIAKHAKKLSRNNKQPIIKIHHRMGGSGICHPRWLKPQVAYAGTQVA